MTRHESDSKRRTRHSDIQVAPSSDAPMKKRQVWARLLAATVLVVFESACASSTPMDPNKDASVLGEEEGGGIATKATCPATQTLTYANFGESFMTNYCLRCHSKSLQGAARKGAPDDHNFDTVEEIRALAEHIDEYAGSGPAGTNEFMPKSGPKPTVDDRQKLAEWIACGAP